MAIDRAKAGAAIEIKQQVCYGVVSRNGPHNHDSALPPKVIHEALPK